MELSKSIHDEGGLAWEGWKRRKKKEICGLNEKYIYSKLLHTLQETFDGKFDALTFILRLDWTDFDSKRTQT